MQNYLWASKEKKSAGPEYWPGRLALPILLEKMIAGN